MIESKSVIRFDIAARNVENKCSYLESFIWNVHSADLMYCIVDRFFFMSSRLPFWN